MKMKLWHRALSFALAFVMILGMIPAGILTFSDAEAAVVPPTSQGSGGSTSSPYVILMKDGASPTIAEIAAYLKNPGGFWYDAGSWASDKDYARILDGNGNKLFEITVDNQNSTGTAGFSDGQYTAQHRKKYISDSVHATKYLLAKTYHEFTAAMSDVDGIAADSGITTSDFTFSATDQITSNGAILDFTKDSFPLTLTVPMPTLDADQGVSITVSLPGGTYTFDTDTAIANNANEVSVSIPYTEGVTTSGTITVAYQEIKYHAVQMHSSLTSGVTYTVTSNGETLTPEDGNYYVKTGSTISLAASGPEGATFLHWWKVNGDGSRELVADPSAVTIASDVTFEAVFQTVENPVAIQNITKSISYTEYEKYLAFSRAASGDTLCIETDLDLSQNVTIPTGVTLIVPFSNSDYSIGDESVYVNANMSYYPSATVDSKAHKFPDVDTAFRTLTLAENVTMTVKGRLCIGGQITAASGGVASGGQTAGSFGKLVLSSGSKVLVQDGGIISSIGYVVGDGTVEVHNGSVYQPFIVVDFNGGSYSAVSSLTAKVASYIRYSMLNIQSKLILHTSEGAKAYGHCNLFGGGGIGSADQHNSTLQLIVGSSNALINATGDVEFLYDNTKKLVGQNGATNNIEDHIGHTTINLNLGSDGTASLGNMSMEFLGVTVKTDTLFYPLPYNVAVNLNSGTFNLGYDLKVLPGSVLYVAEGATLNVNADMILYDGFIERPYANSIYPHTTNLATHYSERARLIVDGTLNINDSGAFGGLIESTGNTGAIKIADGAVLSVTSREGVLISDNYIYVVDVATTTKTTRTLQAQIYDGENLITPTVGENYYAAQATCNEDGSLKSGFTYNIHNDSDVATETTVAYVGDTTIQGMWRTHYVVTFDPNGGNELAEENRTLLVDYESNRYATDPFPTPTKEGYTFAGWYHGDTLVAIDSVPTKGDHTLTAKWTANPYTVTFHTNGGTGENYTQTFAYDESQPLTANAFTREGHTFSNWNTAENGSGTVYTDKQTIHNLTTEKNGNIDLYAQWTVNQYTVTFVPGNGEENIVKTQDYDTDLTAPNDPTKKGYTFLSWDQTVPAKIPAKDLTITAQWAANTYTVTFIPNSGTCDTESMSVIFDQTYGALPTPTRTGYVFEGWFTDDGTFLNQVTKDTVYITDGNTTLYAKWTPGANKYTVQYYTMDTSGNYQLSDTQTITEGVKTEQTITLNPDVAEGFTLDTEKSVLTGTIAADSSLVLKVYYKRNQHALTYMNGDAVHAQYTVYYGAGLPVPAAPDNLGYTFLNWGAPSSTMPNEDLTLTAQWKENAYYVIFNANATEFSGAMAEQNFSIGNTTKLADCGFSRVGYHWVGWSTDLEGTNVVDSVDDLSLVGLADNARINVYAQWELNTYTVVYDKNGGDGSMENGSFTHNDGMADAASCAFTREGYTFDRWNTAANGSGTTCYSGDQLYLLQESDWQNGHVLTLYAQWAPAANKYTVQYYEMGTDSNYKLYDTVSVSNGVKTEDSVTVSPATRTGFSVDTDNSVLTGTVAADGSLVLKVYYARNRYTVTFVDGETTDVKSGLYGAPISFPEWTKAGYALSWNKDDTTIPVDGVTLSAVWTPNTDTPYTVNHFWMNVDGTYLATTTDTESKQGTTDTTASVDTNKKAATGFAVDSEKSVGVNIDGDGTAVLNIYYARQPYTITFNADGGTPVDAITQRYGTEVTAPAVPTKTGYTFAGWDVAVPSTMPAENMTITAQWTINQYTLFYDEAGGNALQDIKANYQTQITELSNAQRTGYRFDGWFYTAGTAVTLPITLEEDVTVVAHWTSYLDLLMDIAPETFVNAESDAEDRAVLEQARTYFNLMKLDADQLNTYQGGAEPYASHWDALEAEIREVSLLELEESIESEETLTKIDDLLDDNGKGGNIAVLYTDAATNYVDICIEDPEYLAGDLLTVPFLPTLLNSPEITSVHFPSLEGHTSNIGTVDSPLLIPITPYGEDGNMDQVNLMVRVAFATINDPAITGREEMTYDQFFNWLYSGTIVVDGETKLVRDVLNIGVLDGKGVEIVVNAETPEGVAYSTTYSLNFYNLMHNANWDVDGTVTTVPYAYEATILAPESPTKTGYTFTGWDGFTEGMTMGKQDITFTATWDVNEYTVTWIVDGQETTVPYKYGQAIVKLADPEKAGYTFTGWSAEIPGTMPAENLTFTAQFEANDYTITFNSDGGTSVGSITKPFGTETSAPNMPTKFGYSFAGWYNGEDRVNFPLNMPVNGMALKAKWNVVPYTINFSLNDGSMPEGVAENATYDVENAVSLPEPTKTGYVFGGWKLTSNGVTTPTSSVAAGATIESFGAGTYAGDMTLEAVWTPAANKYTVEYYEMDTNGNYGEPSSEIISENVKTAQVITLNPTVSEGFSVDTTNSVLTGTVAPDGSLVLKVYYQRNQYQLTFKNGDDTVSATDVYYGATVSKPADLTKTGYLFAGWDAEVPGIMPANNLTFSAQWTANQYTVTFHANDGTASSYTQTFTYDDDQKLTIVTFTRDGYGFTGWNTAENSDGVDYTDGQSVVNLTHENGGNIDLYAQWEAGLVNFTVQHYLMHNDGTYSSYSFSETKAGTTDTTAAVETYRYDPIPEGFSVDTVKSTDVTITGDGQTVLKIYYARNSHTITFVDNHSGATSTQSGLYGVAIDHPDWTRDGYTLSWDKANTTIPAGDLTITAVWTANTDTKYTVNHFWMDVEGNYPAITTDTEEKAGTTDTYATVTANKKAATGFAVDAGMSADVNIDGNGNAVLNIYYAREEHTITFNTAGGTEIAAITQLFGTAVTAPADPTKTGYTFAGWDKEVPATMPAENITITAGWTINQYTVTYDSNGGSTVGSVTQDYNTEVTAPADPTKFGYTFDGWDQNVTTIPAENITVTATWDVNEYTVTYDSNGGTMPEGVTIPTTYTVEDIVALPTPTKTGYDFAGWKLTNSGVQTPDGDVAAGTMISDFGVSAYAMRSTPSIYAGDMALEAVWTPADNQYTVEYYTMDTNGTYNLTKEDVVTANVKTEDVITLTPSVETGFSIDAANSDLEGTVAADGSLTLKVYYARNQYDLVFTNGDDTVQKAKVYYGAAISAPADPTKTGYSFNGWSAAIPTTMPARNLTFNATWTINQYTATFVLGNGEENIVKMQDYDTALTAPADPTKTGYTFAGWDKEVPSTMPAENITISATWNINQYAATFVLGNGEEDIVKTQDYDTALTAPADPTKTGYSFNGWDKEVPSAMPAENITITAKWTVNQYTITFAATGDSMIAPITQDYDTAVTAPADPTKTGYTFAGWDKEVPATMPAENITITAKWTVNQYTITFAATGDSTIAPITQDYDTAVTAPADPTKTGYTFAGWDKEIPATMPAEDITITASWTPNTYTVTFDGNGAGAVVTPASADVTFDDVYGELPTPTRAGYTFDGWFTEEANGTLVTSSTTVTNAAEQGHTLYAHWTPAETTYTVEHWQQDATGDGYTKLSQQTQTRTGITESETVATARTYTGFTPQEIQQQVIAGDGSTVVVVKYDRNVHTLSWDAAGGELSGDYTSGLTRFGAPITAPTATRNGYTFADWGSSVAQTMPDADLPYTANWYLNTYLITYEGMDDATHSNPNAYTVEAADFYLSAPEKTGYTFLGWTWDGQAEPQQQVLIDTAVAENLTFTANWKQNTYTVVFDANGGSGDAFTQTLTWDGGSTALVKNAYSRLGYTFLGWATTDDATAATYADEAPVSNLVSEGSITLYAVWSIDTYSISYNLGSGMVSGQNPANYTVNDSFTLVNPTRTGYTFLGWTVNDSTEQKLEMTVPAGTTGNLVFTANWQINEYSITFHSNGGSTLETITETYRSQVTAQDVADSVKEGYTFKGWYLDEALTTAVTYPVTMTADLDFYAKWEINQYKVTFANTGNSVIPPITQDYDLPITAPEDPIKIGYTFTGWDKEIPAKTPAENITITATWEINQYTITFDNTGDSTIAPITQDYATPVTAPADPVKKGYTFVGWDVAVPSTMPAENMTITAQWTINQYTLSYDEAGGNALQDIKDNYLTQITELTDAQRTGYRFDGWFYADGTAVTLPITLEEDITVVAHWTSYLDLLMAIEPADFVDAESNAEDRAVLEQARTYFNLMKLDADQLSTYQGEADPYASHWDALEAEIREVALLELEESIEGDATLSYVSSMLDDNGDGGKIAVLYADADANYVDVCMETPEYLAGDLLTVPFLPALLNSPDITSVHFPSLEGHTSNIGTVDSPLLIPITPYGEDGEMDQINLLVRVAYATINDPAITGREEMNYDQFFDWLYSGTIVVDGETKLVRDVLAISVLDGKDVEIVINAKTPEGVEFSTTYYLAFYNLMHNASWDVDGTVTTVPYAYEATILAPADPAKAGYTFTGWDGFAAGMTMGKQDITFKATWEANDYTVTFNSDGGTSVGSITQDYNTVVKAPADPTKAGYTFAGWYNGDEKVTFPLNMPENGLALTAKWTAIPYTITFNSDGGTSVGSITQDYNTEVAAPADPTKTGHTFDGWYNGNEKVTFPLNMPIDGMELKAKWTTNQYSITFVLDNGEENIVLTQDYGTPITTPADPAKIGHTFAGWDADIPDYMPAENRTINATWDVNAYTITFVLGNGQPNVTDTLDYGTPVEAPADPTRTGHTFAGWDKVVPDNMPAENVTITAKWTPNTYWVTLDAGAGTVTPDKVSVVYGKPYELPIPQRDGYTFDGWLLNGSPISATVDITTDATFTAAWTLGNPYTITYNFDGGAWAEGSSPRAQYTVETATFTLPHPVREGYTFTGWTGTDLTAPTKEVTIQQGSTGDRTYTATWSKNSYTITWITDTDTITETYAYGDAIVVPDDPTKTGHTFAGWDAEIPATMPAENLTFTAEWIVRQYTVTFVLDNGQGNIERTQDYGKPLTAPADPSKTGYTFAGWDQEVPATTPAENLTITAKWTINQYTVTFANTGNSVINPITQDYGKPITAPEDPVKVGYTFAGWDKTIPETTPAEDITITAKWNINRYNVTFKLDNGEESIVSTQDYGTAITAPADPVREGYTFMGWDQEVPATVPAGDVTITALWEVNVYTITFAETGDTVIKPIQDIYGAPIVAPADPVREGYTFNGWDAQIPTTMPAGDMTITAKWKVNTYTVTYYVDGEVYKTFMLNYDTPLIPESAPVKTGYTFSGWDQGPMLMPAEDVDISGTFAANTYAVSFDANYPASSNPETISVTYDSAYGELPTATRVGYTLAGWTLNGETVHAQTIVKTTGNHTLVAKWTPNTYQVTLDLSGGTCETSTLTVTYGDTYKNLPTPTKDGYDFIGWFDGQTQIQSETPVTITAAQTLVAHWKASGNTPYTVEHYQQQLDGTYVQVLSEALTGAADTETQAQQQVYPGFSVNTVSSITSGTITADGKLVLKLYYDRNSYDVIWNVAGMQITETYVYGETLNVPDTAWAQTDNARYDFKEWDTTLPETVTQSATYTALYNLYYEATIGDVTYRTLALALANAKAGQTVRLARDVTVNEDLLVPKDVLLLVPCDNNDNGYDLKYNGSLKFNYDAPNANGVATLYRTLTVSQGATLTVDGTVLLNSISGKTSSVEQDISGGYAQMQLDGNVIVQNGGELDCFGYIKGSGKVTVENGGTASDMYIVRHWRGGTQAYNMYVANIYPMNEYDCHNIEVDIVVKYGGSYEGLVKMYAGNEYNYTRYPQVHISNGLIRLDSTDGYVIRTYEDGIETYKVYGGAEFASSALTILGVDLTTADFIYPIDGDMRYELYDGRYDIINNYKFLPGSSVTVHSGASLQVNDGVTAVFYQEFNDVDNTGSTEYPAGRDPAIVTIHENAQFTNAGTFGGHIYTESPDIWIGTSPTWETVTKEANGYAPDRNAANEPTYVELPHTLSITRPGHTWSFGVNQSIVWDGVADYGAVQAAISSIPKDLGYYTPESVAAIQPAVDAVIYNLPVEQQAQVDAMAIPIQEAVAGLVPITITVTLDPAGGSVDTTSIAVICTQAIGKLPKATREYYSFLGWFDANGNKITEKTEIWSKTDLTLTAHWEIRSADYTDVVRARRKIPADMSMYSDESVAAVRAAEAGIVEGLTADRQAEVDAMAQAILEAVANLTLDTNVVTFNPAGGTVDPATITVEFTKTYGTLPTPQKKAHQFDGWYNAAGEQVTADSVVVTKDDETLTAHWIVLPADYTDVDAAIAKIPVDLSIYSDASVAAVQNAQNAVVRGLMGDRQAEVDAMAQAILDAIDGLTLYPVQVTFDANGGTVDPSVITVSYTETFGELPVPVLPGHRFDGWFTAGGEQITATSVVTGKEALTLIAKWTAIPADYTAVDAAIEKVPADLSIYSSETAEAVRSAVNAVVRGLNNDRQADVDTMAQAIEEAIAKLELLTIRVTFDANGGSVDVTSITVTYSMPYGQLPTPNRDGYGFSGWYTADGQRIGSETIVTAKTDVALTAKWIENLADYSAVEAAKTQIPADLSIYTDASVAALNGALAAVDYTLTADRQAEVDAMAQAILDAIQNLKPKTVVVTLINEHGQTQNINVTYGEPIGTLPVPTDSCHTFVGWVDAQGNPVTENTVVDTTEGLQLYAKWDDICVEVTGDHYTMIVHYHGESSVVTSVDVTVDDTVTADTMTLRIPASLPTTRDYNAAPPIHVDIPDGFQLRLEIPMDTLHYGNIVVEDLADGTYELKKNSVVWDYGVSLLVTESEDLRVLENSRIFPDVAEDHWAKTSVDYMSSREYLIGKSDGTYGLSEIMDRKMVVLVLWRLAGSPSTDGITNPFPDVSETTHRNYYNAILWAYDNGIVTGHGDGTFRPDKYITREQFAALMHRYAQYIECELPDVSDSQIEDFTDNSTIDPKMTENVQWVIDTGLMNGRGDGNTFDPDGNTSRDQMSAVFFRFLQAYCKELGN